jgi:hypothetical protein
MRSSTAIICFFLLVTACNSPNGENAAVKRTDSTSANTSKADSTVLKPTMVYDGSVALWKYDHDTVINDFRLVKLRRFNKDTLTVKGVESIVNKSWPNVQVKYVRTSGDTIFLSIPASTILTQQMGSSGAEQFMITTTYSFTELPAIRYVSYDFEEGDHASPGIYSREQWKDIRK